MVIYIIDFQYEYGARILVVMKTILWATLTANGNYAQSSAEHPPRPEALADFAAQARGAGNFVVGRRTFESFAAAGSGGGANPFGTLDLVVISHKVQAIPGVTVVASPQSALAHLERMGHRAVLLAGGATLHNAFLSAGLVDELIFNITPVLEGKGHNLVIDPHAYRYQDVQLVDAKPLGSGITQLRYARAR